MDKTGRSKSSDYSRSEATGRYLPNGKLNITGRWNSPGPSYLLPSAIGFLNHDITQNKRPAYSFGKKLQDLNLLPKSPGPMYLPDYKVFNTGKEKSPSYQITGRPRQLGSLHGTPGPGAYEPEKHLNISKPSTPAFTFSRRHKHLELSCHPVGPNQYDIQNTIGNFNFLTKIKTAPAFSISSRHATENNSQNYHGLYYPNIDLVKKNHPKWTIAGRHIKLSDSSQTPGPNQYSRAASYLKTNPRAITMGIRHSEFCSTGFPARDSVDD